MPALVNDFSIPKLRKHPKGSVVVLDGTYVYCGPYGSPQAQEKYDRVVMEWLANGRRLPDVATKKDLTVEELVLRYWRFVQGYYVKNGQPTSEQDTIRQVVRFLLKLYGSTPATEFSPLRLKAVRHAMIEHPITRKIKKRDPATGKVMTDPTTKEPIYEQKLVRQGLARRYINKQVARLKRLFAWAVEEELVPASVHQALARVKGLRKGKGKAREKPRVKSVPWEIVEQTLPHLPATVRTMLLVQHLASMRPEEVILMRPVDIDRSGPVWEYRPHCYKTEHHNDDDDPDRERVIFLGPKAQDLILPYLPANPEAYLFSPQKSEAERKLRRRSKRATPLWPSHVRHQQKKRAAEPKRPPRERYDDASYRRAIHRACDLAGLGHWSPKQLRHTRSTEIRKRYGLEASKAVDGHREIGVTQHYAEQDQERARQVMAEIG